MRYLADFAEERQMTRHEFVVEMLEKHGHNLAAVSRDVGLSRQALYVWLKSNGFKRDRKQMKWVEVSRSDPKKRDGGLKVGSQNTAAHQDKANTSRNEGERITASSQS